MIKFEADKDVETKMNEIVDTLMRSSGSYKMTIQEEKLNDVYQNVYIKIIKENNYD